MVLLRDMKVDERIILKLKPQSRSGRYGEENIRVTLPVTEN
jgi:hypothetical protein